MNQNLEHLMYLSGLTAQGCWDEMDMYDQEAVMKFADLIVRECATVAQINSHQWSGPEQHVLEHFGISQHLDRQK